VTTWWLSTVHQTTAASASQFTRVLSAWLHVQVPDAASGKPVTAAQRVLRGAAEAAQLPPASIATPQSAALATLAGV
jgi:hypothetical protein